MLLADGEHSRKRKNIPSGVHTMRVRTSRKEMGLRKSEKWDLRTEMSGCWGELAESLSHYDLLRDRHGKPWVWNLETGTDLKIYTQCMSTFMSMCANTHVCVPVWCVFIQSCLESHSPVGERDKYTYNQNCPVMSRCFSRQRLCLEDTEEDPSFC